MKRGQAAAWEDQLNALDSSGVRTSFVSTVCAHLTTSDSELRDFLSACQWAVERNQPLTELCTALNSLQVIKDLVLPRQLAKAETETVKRVVTVLMEVVGRERSEAVLRTLGSVVFWPQIHLIGVDEEVVAVCRDFLVPLDSPKLGQLALECVGNMLRRSNTALNCAKVTIYPFFQSLTDFQSTEKHIKVRIHSDLHSRNSRFTLYPASRPAFRLPGQRSLLFPAASALPRHSLCP